MSNQAGKIVVVGFFLVASMMGFFSIWYLRGLRNEAIEFWGKPTALVIRDAPQVELLTIVAADEAESDENRLAGTDYAIGNIRVIDGEPGLYHLRLNLLDNGTFRFESQPTDSASWDAALRFSGPKIGTATVVFSIEQGQLWHLESGRKADISPQIEFISHFLEDAAD